MGFGAFRGFVSVRFGAHFGHNSGFNIGTNPAPLLGTFWTRFGLWIWAVDIGWSSWKSVFQGFQIIIISIQLLAPSADWEFCRPD